MTKAAAKTGLGPTISVAVEQYYPKDRRIVDDQMAYRILPLGARAFVWLMRSGWARRWMIRVSERLAPGIWGGVLCRKRYIDDKLIASAGQIDAVVNLGAGFDTRAYRLPDLAGVPVWEVDQAESVVSKRARLRKALGADPAGVTLVPIDFDHEELGVVLPSHGWQPDRCTFFVWEAVTQYLTETGIRAALDFLATSASGSRLAFTYIRKDFLDGTTLYNQHAIYRKYVVRDKTWLFALDPDVVADSLLDLGWCVIEHVGYEELAERYAKPIGRALAATPIERIVYAQKA
jgi:methyltransferase (TIGR00027 family)